MKKFDKLLMKYKFTIGVIPFITCPIVLASDNFWIQLPMLLLQLGTIMACIRIAKLS
jgi:hypothetical protein